MKKLSTNCRSEYLAPSLELSEFAVESGIANSPIIVPPFPEEEEF